MKDDFEKYRQEIKFLQSERRTRREQEKEEHNNEVNRLREKYKIPAKGVVILRDLIHMVSHVLETGDSGTITIRKYAEESGKTGQWKKDIAKYKAGDNFKKALQEHKNNSVIISMKTNNIYDQYDQKDLLNNTITGALKKLSKQMKMSKLIDDLRDEVAMLKENLAAKTEGKDWKEKAIELDNLGWSVRRIAEAVGVGKTVVGFIDL